MKKIISLLLLFCVCLSLCSCANSTAAADCEELIDNIGEVSLESEGEILAAREKYDALFLKDRELVRNYDLLISAEQEFQKLKESDKNDRIQKLLENFTVTEDKIEGFYLLYHKKIPEYIDERSYVAPLLFVADDVDQTYAWICVRYNCLSDTWHFWNSLKFYIDGERLNKDIGAFNTTFDSVGSLYWEYYDEILEASQDTFSEELTLLKKIADSTETIIRFQGSSTYYDLVVTQQDKDIINDVLELYSLLIG